MTTMFSHLWNLEHGYRSLIPLYSYSTDSQELLTPKGIIVRPISNGYRTSLYKIVPFFLSFFIPPLHLKVSFSFSISLRFFANHHEVQPGTSSIVCCSGLRTITHCASSAEQALSCCAPERLQQRYCIYDHRYSHL